MATLMVGLGTMACIRWTAQLLRHELELRQRTYALHLLHNAFEGDRGQGTVEQYGTRYMGAHETRHQPEAGDPRTGAHELIEIRWLDLQGIVQSVRLRTYRTPPARLY